MKLVFILFFLGWSSDEINLIKKYFNTYITEKTYPSSTQIKEFLENNNCIDRSVPVIKAKIQHLMKQK